MAHKRIEDGMIHTTNGVDTLTSPFYVRQLRTFTPLPNGFNAELATYVVDFIEQNAALWDQHSWRVLFELDESTQGYQDVDWLERKAEDSVNPQTTESIQAQLMALARDVDATENPSCGSAMCLAGWIGELTGADWVLDRSELLKSKVTLTQNERAALAEMLLVPGPTVNNLGEQLAHFRDNTRLGSSPSDKLHELLASRGFTPATHHFEHVREWAKKQLGLPASVNGFYEMPMLFEGTNTIEDLRAVIELYAAHGPDIAIDFAQLPSYQEGGVNFDSDVD